MTVRERVEDDEMEVCNGGEVPAIETQNRIIKTHMNSTLHEGDVWRLIPFKWFEVFISSVRRTLLYYFYSQEWREYAHGKIKECSPLDISILFESGKLKTGLKENQDYSLLPEDAYRLLNEWHGKRGQKGTYFKFSKRNRIQGFHKIKFSRPKILISRSCENSNHMNHRTGIILLIS